MYKRTGELPWLARHICLGYSYAGLVKVKQERDIVMQSVIDDYFSATLAH